MNSHSFLMLGSTFIFGAFASTWAPDTTWLHYLYISLLICIPLTLIRQYIGALCISFFAGALLVISSTLGVLENHVQLPTNQRVVEAVGTVLDYPDVNVWRARFELQIISSNRTEIKAGHKFQINCYECPYSVQRGDTWQLILKLKPPHGYANAAGFDYEKWLLRNRIHATGYVKDHAASKLIRAANLGPIGQTRIRIGRSGVPESFIYLRFLVCILAWFGCLLVWRLVGFLGSFPRFTYMCRPHSLGVGVAFQERQSTPPQVVGAYQYSVHY